MAAEPRLTEMPLTASPSHCSPCRLSCLTAFIPPWCNVRPGPWLCPSKSRTATVDPVTPSATTILWQPATWSWKTCWKSTSQSPSMSLGSRPVKGYQVLATNMPYLVQDGALKWSFYSWVFIPGMPFVGPSIFIEPHSLHLWNGNS